jgi:anti-anti-sigma regulatory factor
MIFDLSDIYSNLQGYEELTRLAKETAYLRHKQLKINFSSMTQFDANMAASLGAILVRVEERNNTIKIINVPSSIEHILRKNNFLKQYKYQPMKDETQTVIPFQRLMQSEGNLFADYLQKHLKGKSIPHMSEGLSNVFKQKIFEVFQNSVIHSDSKLGIFVCGQFFVPQQKLDLTIADAGIGIRDNVRRYYNDDKITSVPAIRWALREGNTTKTGQQPGGLGLKLLQDFTRLNKGRIQIVSRFGFYELNGNNESFVKMKGDYHGTVVNIEINTADTSSYRLKSEVSEKNIF